MRHPSTIRHRRAGEAAPTLAVAVAAGAVLAALAFVAVAFVARPAHATGSAGARDAASGRDPVALTQMASTDHPDFVGVAEPRSPAGVVHLVASPTAVLALIAVVLVVVAVARAGGAGPPRSRWRRWRARLEGAPPVVA